MKIRTQFIVTLSFFILILIGMTASLLITNQEVDRLRQQEEIARRERSFDLNQFSKVVKSIRSFWFTIVKLPPQKGA